MKNIIARGVVALSLCAWEPTWAQTAVTVPQEYDKLIQSRTAIQPLGPDLFGDRINLYTGSLEFIQTDIATRGNNALDVSLGRHFRIDRSAVDFTGKSYSDWDLEIPHIHAVFPEAGWKAGGQNPDARCTNYGTPPSVYGIGGNPWGGSFSAAEYWHGTSLYLPGNGDEEILGYPAGLPLPAPNGGAAYKLRTKGGTALRCIALASTSEGAGEGFEAITPEGITYKFNHMASRGADSLEKPAFIQPSLHSKSTSPSFAPDSYLLNRKEYWLLPTSASDRFGNTVTYTWSTTAPWQLIKIQASDGRLIEIEYASPTSRTIVRAKHAGQTWNYQYQNGSLSAVILPDNSQWKFSLGAFYWLSSYVQGDGGCGGIPRSEALLHTSRSGSITHPAGAQGAFTVKPVVLGRSWVSLRCDNAQYDSSQYTVDPAEFWFPSLSTKVVYGPGIPAAGLTWTYAYGPANNCYLDDGTYPGLGVRCTANSPTTRTISVTDPTGTLTRHTFGNKWRASEGDLLKVETGVSGASAARAVANTYAATTDGAYPQSAGLSYLARGDGAWNARQRPVRQVSTSQDGEVFTWKVNTGCSGKPYCFDLFARPISTTRTNTLPGNPSRTEVTTYDDDTTVWVLGQVANVKCTDSVPASSACDGDVVVQTDYGWKALPWKTYRFGKLQQTLEYRLDGTLRSVADGRDSVTELSGFKRGIPQRIDYPITPDQPSGSARSALVNDDGTIESITDENEYKTCYEYDAMGRLAKVTHPSESTSGACNNGTWAITAQTFTQTSSARYGLPAGHWVQVTSIGDGRKTVDYDALWRPVVETTYDAANIAGTRSIVVKRYDAAGRLAFQSYPLASVANYADTTLKGTRYTYDALDRPTQVTQNWENEAALGPLTTTTAYLSNANGYYTRVTNPGGLVTYTFYQAFDQPSYDAPIAISNSGSQYTDITRDPFGKPTAITRRNYGGTVSATRYYAYNGAQELCRMIEPETGATIMGYDAAGNLKWSAAGLPTTLACDPEGDHSAIAPRRVDRGYDARNRLRTVSFPDDIGDTVYHYTPDSLLDSVLVDNGSGNVVRTSYGYNRRRLLASERMEWGSIDWSLTYGYDGNGHPDAVGYPDGTSIDFAPDALGRPTRAGTYATGATYHPNGMLASFRYGNAMERTVAVNERGLPERIRDAYDGATPAIAHDEGYDYDSNGNVLGISDGIAGARGNRDMEYDLLDRLEKATSPMFGTASYSYDVLDNLTLTKVTGGGQSRTYYYCYNANWQLTFVRSGSVCTGSTPSPSRVAFEYDAQGNLKERDNVSYAFDFGNRLRSVDSPATSYVYDGHGRRVRDATGASKYSLYSQAGALMFVSDLRTGKQVRNVYLGNTLVAELEKDTATGAITNRYLHTDALGSVAARSSQGRGSVLRNEYEPFGAFSNRDNYDRPGYTGHVMDAATGLTYMQQRYYDPMIGRFLSVDPVAPDTITGSSFNRYNYAANNPYKFIDPDGREIRFAKGAPADFLRNVAIAIRYLNQNGVATPIGKAHLSKEVVTIEPASNRADAAMTQYDPRTQTVTWADMGGVEVNNYRTGELETMSPALALGHEFEHVVNRMEAPNSFRLDARTPDATYDTQEERNVIEGYERPAAERLGEGQRGNHSGKPIVTACPTPECN